jgi:uncharacterized membrane protein (DUF4010 family)
LLGPGHGYLATGLIGGLVSSTNVTFTFARNSRTEPALSRELAIGAVAANVMLFPRVLVAAAILNPSVVVALWPYLALPALVALVVMVTGLRGAPVAADAAPLKIDNPLQLWAALQMAVLFQVVLWGVYLAREAWGESGVLASAAILGLTDADALTLSMARGVAQTSGPAIAATAIAVGVLSNTVLKSGLAFFLGSARFRLIAGGTLLLMAAALALGFFVL